MQRTFMDKLKEALNTVHGGFAYLLMTEDAMIGALDPNGFRPLSLGKMRTAPTCSPPKPAHWMSSRRAGA